MTGLGFPIDNSYYEKSSYFYARNSPAAVKVWVESRDDVRLWRKVFQSSNKDYVFEVSPISSFFEDGKMGDGCGRIQKLIADGQITLGRNAVACIDSDYSYFIELCRGGGRNYFSPYIYETRVHSKENVCITPDSLFEAVAHCLALPNETALVCHPREIFDEVSKLIFKPLILAAYFSCEDHGANINICAYYQSAIDAVNLVGKIGIDDFPAYKNATCWLRFVSEIESVVLDAENELQQRGLIADFDRFMSDAVNAGVTDSKAYYFLRGHNLKAIMVNFFIAICGYHKKTALSQALASLPEGTSRKVVSRVKKEHSVENLNVIIKSAVPIIDGVDFFSDTVRELRVTYQL
ncbi:MAG: DUF4435 domain-containing protein [Halothiobacillaceae bacterium]